MIIAAVVGALNTRKQNPNVPYSSQEIANAAIDAWRAEASMVHLHVRNTETGACVQKVDNFRELIEAIKSRSDGGSSEGGRKEAI